MWWELTISLIITSRALIPHLGGLGLYLSFSSLPDTFTSFSEIFLLRRLWMRWKVLGLAQILSLFDFLYYFFFLDLNRIFSSTRVFRDSACFISIRSWRFFSPYAEKDFVHPGFFCMYTNRWIKSQGDKEKCKPIH